MSEEIEQLNTLKEEARAEAYNRGIRSDNPQLSKILKLLEEYIEHSYRAGLEDARIRHQAMTPKPDKS